MIINNQTDGKRATCRIWDRVIFSKMISFSALSSNFINNQTKIPTSATIPEDTRITYLKAALLSESASSETTAVINIENIRTPIAPNSAPTRPRPPSKNPKALPCEPLPPQNLVAFIIGAQNKNIVVNPQ